MFGLFEKPKKPVSRSAIRKREEAAVSMFKGVPTLPEVSVEPIEPVKGAAPAPAAFRVHRTGKLTYSLAVRYAMSVGGGPARLADIIIPAGATSVDLEIPEKGAAAWVFLRAGPGYTVGPKARASAKPPGAA